MGRAEGSIENYLRRRVKEEGGQIRKVRWLCRRGAPDDLIWWPGPRVAFVECKAPGERVDPRSPQGREITRLRDDGWTVYVVDNHEGVDAAISATKDQ